VRATKIVFVGAGSSDFGPRVIADVVTNPAMKGSTLSLVDVDAAGLELIDRLARRMNEEWGGGLTIESSVDRREALPEAEFVVVMFEVEREKRWRMDYEIPLKYGLRQPLAENGGPGAFAHAARNIPHVLGVCKDMRELCAEAWFFNFTNPVPRITLTAHRYGGVKAAGFCHGIEIGLRRVSALLGVPREDLDIKAAGLNHFTWVLDVRRKSTGEDLYGALRQRLDDWPEGYDPLTREVFADFGVFPVIGGSHMAEYLPWVCDPQTKPWAKYGLELYDWEAGEAGREGKWQKIRDQVAGGESIDDYRRGSGERAIAVVEALVADGNSFELAMNVPNDGSISNLPQGAIVEVPAVVSGMGISAVSVGELAGPIAELCRRQIVVAELGVEAAVKGDRGTALQALLLDPMITDIEQARGILDGYLKAHGDLLPQFG